MTPAESDASLLALASTVTAWGLSEEEALESFFCELYSWTDKQIKVSAKHLMRLGARELFKQVRKKAARKGLSASGNRRLKRVREKAAR